YNPIVLLNALLTYSSLSSFTPRLPPRSTLFPYTTLFRSSMQIRNLNSLLESTRTVIMEKYHPKEDNTLLTLKAAQIDEDEYFARSEETRLNSSHVSISYAVFCLKKKKRKINTSLLQKNQM